jgi:hypothetical protein
VIKQCYAGGVTQGGEDCRELTSVSGQAVST